MDEAYVLDSYALIAHLEDESGGERVTNLLRTAAQGKIRLYLSVVNLGEVYYNIARQRGSDKAGEALFMIDQLPVTTVDVSRPLAISAATLKAKYPVAYADCFAAALAMELKARVVTGDPEFRLFEKDVAVEWIG